jgi:drug/metabolite transporter (DMT)-like permease
MSLASTALVSAESILALTPIAIKKTPLDPHSAIWSRLLSSAALGYIVSGEHMISPSEVPSAAALGYTNLLHVASSYESFRNLPAGQAMSLLYTYPFWNLILAAIFTDETIQMHQVLIMGVASVGSVLLNMDPGIAAPTALGREANPRWGVFMGLVMALTESGIHTILKSLGWLDPAKSVWVVNTSAAFCFGIALLAQTFLIGDGPSFHLKGTWWDAALLTVFHGVTLFSGYWLRFYAVPRLSTVTYSILSYAGLLASYIFGLLFLKETPGWMSVLGAIVIVVSGLMISPST